MHKKILNVGRITKTKDYSRITKTSNKFHSKSFIILYNKLSEEELVKFGMTVSKRVGNSVKRNYCKRLIKNIIRDLLKQQTINPTELVIIAKKSMLEQNYDDLRNEFIKGLKNLK